MTEQNRPIEFEIDGIGMVALEYGWVLPLCSSTNVLSLPSPARVIDGHVDYSLRAPSPGMSTVIAIDFASESLATGELTFTLPQPPGPRPPVPPCTGSETVTFTATKMLRR